MKNNIFLILIILLSMNSYSQNIEKNSKNFSCEELNKRVIDSSLYLELNNGKKVFNINLHEMKLYKIIYNTNKIYYVSKPVMKKIRRSIRRNKCNDIIITKLDKLSDGNFKIIRD